MRRDQLEHAIRAATDVLQEESVIVIGSQSILGSVDEAELPAGALWSMEVDVLPVDDPAETKADEVDGAIGEGSMFHETHGFYVQGVGQRTATLPRGWRERLSVVSNANTGGRTGFCIEPHDLCVAKLVAGREKDYEFCLALISGDVIDPRVIAQRLAATTLSSEDRARINTWLQRFERHPRD